MKINVKHIAKLAELSLNKDEEKKFETQLSAILEYVQQLGKVDVSKVPQTSQVTGLENIMKEDAPAPSFTQQEALANAPGTQNSFFKVKAILEE